MKLHSTQDPNKNPNHPNTTNKTTRDTLLISIISIGSDRNNEYYKPFKKRKL